MKSLDIYGSEVMSDTNFNEGLLALGESSEVLCSYHEHYGFKHEVENRARRSQVCRCHATFRVAGKDLNWNVIPLYNSFGNLLVASTIYIHLDTMLEFLKTLEILLGGAILSSGICTAK